MRQGLIYFLADARQHFELFSCLLELVKVVEIRLEHAAIFLYSECNVHPRAGRPLIYTTLDLGRFASLELAAALEEYYMKKMSPPALQPTSRGNAPHVS